MLLWGYFTQYVKVQIGYRADFLISLGTSFAATIFQLGFVLILFQKIPRLAGWTFPEVLFLYGFSLIPYGLFNVISLNLYNFGNNYIIEGKFDRVLLRPVSSLVSGAVRAISHRGGSRSGYGNFLCMRGQLAAASRFVDTRQNRHVAFLRTMRGLDLPFSFPNSHQRVFLVRGSHRSQPARVERDRFRPLPALDLQRRSSVCPVLGDSFRTRFVLPKRPAAGPRGDAGICAARAGRGGRIFHAGGFSVEFRHSPLCINGLVSEVVWRQAP